MFYMKMTLEIPDDLFREVKAKAALEGRKLKDLVADSLRETLLGKTMGETRQHVQFPIIKRKGSSVLTAVKDIAEIEDTEEALYYARFMRH
jgi:hypothetical protein